MAQPLINLPISSSTKLKDNKIGIFIDISGSTSELFSADKILDVETRFANNLSQNLTSNPVLIGWNDNAIEVSTVNELNCNGGTRPSCIFNEPIKQKIDNIDVAVILTDGVIDVREINNFAQNMLRHGLQLKAIIGVIIGHTGAYIPSKVNISVLVPAMINNSCILFNNDKASFVMWSSGCFKATWNPIDILDNTSWNDATRIDFDQIINVNVPLYSNSEINNSIFVDYIPFGSGCYFNPNIFLNYKPSWDELLALPFDRICQYFRIINKYDDLITWFTTQKNRFVQEFMVSAIDENQINRLIDRLVNRNSQHVDETIFTTYVQVRNRTLTRSNFETHNNNIDISDPRLVKLVRFFRNMMNVMYEDRLTLRNARTYTTGTFSTTRYSTASVNNPNNSFTLPTVVDFSNPLKWYAQFKLNENDIEVDCSICLEKSIPFFLIRKHFELNNLSEFHKIPMNYFYPQQLCANCATYFCNRQQDPVKVSCYAGIPIAGSVDIFNYINNFSKLTDSKDNLIANPDQNIIILTVFRHLIKFIKDYHRSNNNASIVDAIKAVENLSI